jgi:YHS domain-containing protein
MKRRYTRGSVGALAVLLLTVALTGGAYAWMGNGAFGETRSPIGGVSLLADAAHRAHQGERQALCPITGEKIDPSTFVDYQGKRVYFCCASCKKAFLKDPQKYIDAMESKGIVLEKAP